MNFFEELELVLRADNIKSKFELFDIFYKRFLNSEFEIDSKSNPKIFDKPSYYKFLEIVEAKEVLSRKNLFTIESKAILTHSIVHIEYSAIDLALDACYRYRDLPIEFYSDWLEVAKEEIEHFLMLNSILENLGYRYGSFSVHAGLFEASNHSLEFIDRMALIPRYMEANGLDSNPILVNRLQSQNKTFNLDLIDALAIILRDEITHVQKGDKWFKFACEQRGISIESYFEIIERIYPNSITKKRKAINREARVQAGFSEDELDRLSF